MLLSVDLFCGSLQRLSPVPRFCILMQGAFCISIAYVLEIFIRLSEGYSIAVSLLNHIQCVSYFPMAFCLHLLGMWNVQASHISVDCLSPSDEARG